MRLFKLIILLFILLLFISTTSALIPIHDCTIISDPGEYKLTKNINNYQYSTCIEISSNDVIVDGAGHTIYGYPYSSEQTFGVTVDDCSNVTVKNLKLTDLDFGIYYYYVDNGFIFNNDVSYINVTGIIIDSSDYITISENNASNNDYGINILSSDYTTLTNNFASNNYYAIRLWNSFNSILENNSASNSDWGFALYDSNSNTLEDNIAFDNICGIRLKSSNNNYLIGNIANSNNFSGIYLTTSQNNMFEDNTVLDNSNWDFYSNEGSINNDVINLNIGPTISFTSKDVIIKGSSSPASDPPGYRNINKYIYATRNSQDSWLFMNVSYSDIDVEDVDENTLLMWKYDNVWSQVSGTNGVNTVQNYVFADITSFSIFAPMANLPPANIANLQNITYAQNYINWTWTDPNDADFAKVMVYLDMVWVDNVSKDVQYYNATDLTPDTNYTISTQTVDSEGNINQTFVNNTSTTAPPPDTEPPASVTNLKNVSYAQNYINWTWTDPNDADFAKVM
ncbi:MAG: right-handed parallel beta-helix repeat-containing protein, partial [Methanosarcinales archaeon]|nr:right-handed parallel beta-helix repeat-containing protein [Methanosarcinales archaeon]